MCTLIQETIEELIHDYSWMKQEVIRLQRLLYGRTTSMKNWGVASYGIEATLPTGSKGKSQAELRDMDIREERLHKRIVKLERKVYALEIAAEYLDSEKERVVYDCLLDQMSYRSIAYHVGISRNQAKKAKESIMNQLSQSSQFVALLELDIVAC